jgi:hypothetical protein
VAAADGGTSGRRLSAWWPTGGAVTGEVFRRTLHRQQRWGLRRTPSHIATFVQLGFSPSWAQVWFPPWTLSCSSVLLGFGLICMYRDKVKDHLFNTRQ